MRIRDQNAARATYGSTYPKNQTAGTVLLAAFSFGVKFQFFPEFVRVLRE
jgi:hypothetical protein